MSLITSAYTRKKLLEHVLEGTAEGFASVLQAGEEQEKAKQREKAAAGVTKLPERPNVQGVTLARRLSLGTYLA